MEKFRINYDPLTNCKLHCGVGAGCRFGFPHDCLRPGGRTITRKSATTTYNLPLTASLRKKLVVI